jgi:hypothetical protein
MSQTIFTLSAPQEVLTLSHNRDYLSTMEHNFVQEEVNGGLNEYSDSSIPTPASFKISLISRFTTADRPKNLNVGFIFKSDIDKCNI